MRKEIRIETLHEFHPTRATGGELRQGSFLARLRYALDEFGPLLHDGDVSRVLVVPYVFEAELLQGGVHLSTHVGSRRIAEALAQGIPDSRSGHGHDDRVLVLEFGRDFVHVSDPFIDGPVRTVNQALAAVDAGGRVDHLPDAGLVLLLDGTCRAMIVTLATPLAFGRIHLDEKNAVGIDSFGCIVLVHPPSRFPSSHPPVDIASLTIDRGFSPAPIHPGGVSRP